MKEYLDWLEWLRDDEHCTEDHKLPEWIKNAIDDKIKEINDLLSEDSK